MQGGSRSLWVSLVVSLLVSLLRIGYIGREWLKDTTRSSVYHVWRRRGLGLVLVGHVLETGQRWRSRGQRGMTTRYTARYTAHTGKIHGFSAIPHRCKFRTDGHWSHHVYRFASGIDRYRDAPRESRSREFDVGRRQTERCIGVEVVRRGGGGKGRVERVCTVRNRGHGCLAAEKRGARSSGFRRLDARVAKRLRKVQLLGNNRGVHATGSRTRTTRM